MKNKQSIIGKKGIAPLLAVLTIFFALIVVYCLLFIPIPAFTQIRMVVNYFLIIILWIIIQVALFYGYFKLGSFAFKGMRTLQHKVASMSLKIRHLIITKK